MIQILLTVLGLLKYIPAFLEALSTTIKALIGFWQLAHHLVKKNESAKPTIVAHPVKDPILPTQQPRQAKHPAAPLPSIPTPIKNESEPPQHDPYEQYQDDLRKLHEIAKDGDSQP